MLEVYTLPLDIQFLEDVKSVTNYLKGDTMTQTDWSSLGTPVEQTTFPSSSTVGRNADGRLEVFFISQDGTLWHIWQTSPGGTWSTWASLNKSPNISFSSGTTVGENADGRLEVFNIGSDGALWHIWQTTAGGDWYNSWFSSGQPSASVGIFLPTGVIQNEDGRLEVFALGRDDALWHIWQTLPNGKWSTWASFGTPSNVHFTTAPSVARNKDGRLEVLITGSAGDLWHIWQTSPGRAWSTFVSLGTPPNTSLTPFSSPVVSENADGRLEVFAQTGGAFWHAWQITPGGSWG